MTDKNRHITKEDLSRIEKNLNDLPYGESSRIEWKQTVVVQLTDEVRRSWYDVNCLTAENAELRQCIDDLLFALNGDGAGGCDRGEP